MWVETKPNCQSPLQKLNVDNTWQKHKELYITFLKFCPILLYFFSLCQIFLLGLSEKTSFLLELGQVSFTYEFVDIFRNSKHFSNHDVNIKQCSSVTSTKFNGFCVSSILYSSFQSKFDFRNLSTLPISCFLNKLTFLSQNWYFFPRKLKHHWKSREQMKIFKESSSKYFGTFY